MPKILRFPRLDVGKVSRSVIEEVNKKYRRDKKNEFVLEMLGDSIFSSDRPFLKLGIPPLDEIIGMGEGFPAGIVEIYGPNSSGKTAVIEKATAQAQKKDWYVLFFCAEYSLNYKRCIRLGIDEDKLIMLDAETLEDFFDQVKDTINQIRKNDTNTPILVIWDSIAATPASAEMEQKEGLNDNEMARLARQMSKLFRRMTRFLFKNKVCMLAVNQTRSNIGQRFGCVQGATLVNFTDGRSLPIKEIVDNRIEGKVFSLNRETNSLEKSPIVGWHNNGINSDRNAWVHIESESVGTGGGKLGLTVTRDHKILINKIWVKAKRVKVGDFLTSRYKSKFNGTLRDFLSGALVGDSCIQVRSRATACIKFQDSKDPEYLAWKLSKLKKVFDFHTIETGSKKGSLSFISKHEPELAIIKSKLGERNPRFFFKRYSDMGLAIWIMDDAHFSLNRNRYALSVKRLRGNKAELQYVTKEFSSRGMQCSFNPRNGLILFTKRGSKILAEKIAPFVPTCMDQKLPEKLQGKYSDFSLVFRRQIKTTKSKVVAVRPASSRQMRIPGLYDLSIKGNKNYMVGGIHNGVIIHNSPETTTGGKALSFYAWVRLRLAKIETLKDSNHLSIGYMIEARTTKNKTGAWPDQKCKFPIYFDRGIDSALSCWEFCVDRGIFKKEGTAYKYRGNVITRKVFQKFYETHGKEIRKRIHASTKVGGQP